MKNSWKPLLEIYIAIPFIKVETFIVREEFMRAQREYVGLRIQIWKWETRFRLYKNNLPF